MAQISQLLFPIGTIAIALGFAAHIGHAVMLANGRRSLPPSSPNRQPAWAGVVTGAFAESRTSAAVAGPDLAGSPTPLGRAAVGLTAIGFGVLLASLILRGDRRRARAVGQHVRVHGRLRDLDRRRLSRPAAPLPDPLDRLHPGRHLARDAPVRVEPSVGHQRPGAGPPERAAADDPRRDGGDLVRDLRDQLRGGGRLSRPGPRRPLPMAAVAQGPRRGRLPIGHLRLPDLRDDDHPRARGGPRSPGRATGAGTRRRPLRS